MSALLFSTERSLQIPTGVSSVVIEPFLNPAFALKVCLRRQFRIEYSCNGKSERVCEVVGLIVLSYLRCVLVSLLFQQLPHTPLSISFKRFQQRVPPLHNPEVSTTLS